MQPQSLFKKVFFVLNNLFHGGMYKGAKGEKYILISYFLILNFQFNLPPAKNKKGV